MVEKDWTSFGLIDWKVIELQAGADGSQPYSVQAILTWEEEESLSKALAGEEGKTVKGDAPNFSNKDPILVIGNVVGSG